MTEAQSLPPFIDAMKAETIERLEVKPFDPDFTAYTNSNWIAQEKYDGTRVLAIKRPGKIWLMTRKWLSNLTVRYPGIVKEFSQFPDNTVLDTELVFFKKSNGKSEFITALATPEVKSNYSFRLMAFDILEYQGQNYRNIPQSQRINFLDNIIPDGMKHIETIKTVRSPDKFNAFYHEVTGRGGEGLMLKNIHSKYYEGSRTKDWVKAKKLHTDEGFVLGITQGKNKYASSFGALVIGQYINGKVSVVGKVSGMTDSLRSNLNSQIRAMPKDTNPSDIWKGAIAKETIHRIKPGDLVVECAFMERTVNNIMRHPRFLRIRDDKPFTECIYKPAAEMQE